MSRMSESDFTVGWGGNFPSSAVQGAESPVLSGLRKYIYFCPSPLTVTFLFHS